MQGGEPTLLNVAICITGQIARLQPQHLIENLINANPVGFNFHVFYVLQTNKIGHKARFNTGTGYEPTKFAFLPHHELKSELKEMFETNYSAIREVNLVEPTSTRGWEHTMDDHKLNRITQYEKVEDSVLNMYNKQVVCANDISQYERKLGKNFTLIVNTREDAYFFQPLNLTAVHIKYIMEEECGVVTKNCLAWGGVSMRFQLYNHDTGLDVLGKRLTFYHSLYDVHSSVNNPERFEEEQLAASHVKVCPVSVESIPVCAARHTSNGNFCFILYEIGCDTQECHDWGAYTCHPPAASPFLMDHICPVNSGAEHKKQHINYSIYFDVSLIILGVFLICVVVYRCYFANKRDLGDSSVESELLLSKL